MNRALGVSGQMWAWFLLLSSSVIAQEQPNVLFIAVDDLRPELGCYGVEQIITPNIDALAARGVVFTRAYCQQAVCNPSRVSLLTGLRPDSAKVWDLVTEFRDTIPDVVTLPQHFKQNGYYAVGMGKIFHNPFPDPISWTTPQQPKPEGHVLYSQQTQERLSRARDEARRAGMSEREIGNRIRGPATDVEDVPDNRRFDGALADLALEHLQKADAQQSPFFLAVGFILPHLPWTPPKKYWDLYDPAEIPTATNDFLPKGMPAVAFGDRSMGGMYELMDCMDLKNAPSPFEGSLTEAQRRRLKHGYYASVSLVDAQVGRLMEELNRLGLDENTIVVLWGDHGWKLGEHNGWCKQTNYEVDTRSPLIVAAPGAKANGKSCGSLVEFVDIYPTLCDLAGLPVPSTLEGVSLAPLLEDPSGSVKPVALSQFPRRHEGVQSMGYTMRTDRYRYVEWVRLDTGEVTDAELYDETQDPEENVNIADEPGRKQLRTQLHGQLWEYFSRPKPGMLLRTPKPKQAKSAKRPALHIENRWDEPVSIYWVPADGPRKRVGFIAPGGRQTQQTTLGHRFVFEGVRSRSFKEFTAGKQEQTLVLAPGDRSSLPAAEATGKPTSFEVTAPPSELQVDPFYGKYIDAGGYPIVASENVNDLALKEAAYLVGLMTAERPDVLEMMVASGSRLCILGYDEYTTDLPEFADFEPKNYWDARARGTGGSREDPYCSCGEENLLGYPGDPYTAECILIHEFAHNIHLRGLVNVDPTFDDRLKEAYEAAMREGLWKGKYAAMNHHEYFAEGVQSWFDNNRPPDHDHNHVDTRRELIEYDPGLAAICREVFGDTELVYTKPATRLHGHMAGYDPSGAPTFVWPERLDDARGQIKGEVERRNREQAREKTSREADADRPNILFLMGDDWSAPHAGVLGDPVVTTPTFDRIAREGVLFTNAFVSAPSCTPSRLAVASGQYHWRLKEGKDLGGSLRADVPVYPEMLQAAGYKIGFCRKGATPSQYTFTGHDPFGPRFKSFEEFCAERRPKEPFCFWYGAGEPHRPYVWQDGVESGMDISEVEVPACLPDNETTRTDLCDYYEKIQQFDQFAAEMLALLEESGELENAIVVMSGDNGLPFPRCKATLYDMGTHVPLAIRWGAKVPGGRTVEDFVSLCDLAPTFLEAAGLKPAVEMTGKTLLPILTSDKSGRLEPARDHVLTAMEQHVFPYPSRAIRTADYLYIVNYDLADWKTGRGEGPLPNYDFSYRHWPSGAEAFSFNIDPSPTKQFMLQHPDDPSVKPVYALAFGARPEEELYDLKTDPGQLNNVADDAAYSEIKWKLRERLEAGLRSSEDPRVLMDGLRQ